MQKLPILRYPKIEEAKYKRLLLTYVRDIKSIVSANLLPKLNRRNDDIIDELAEIFDLLDTQIGLQTLIVIRQMDFLIRAISLTLIKRARSILPRSSKIEEIIRINNPLSSEIEETIKSTLLVNVSLIKSIPEKLLGDMRILIDLAYKEGWSITKLTEEINGKFEVSKNRARLIARDQIGKLSSSINKIEQLSLGITEYIWSTSHDDRVRLTHSVMNNKICQWNDPTTYRDKVNQELKKRSSINGVEKQVGEDFQCRCSIIAIIPNNL